MLHIAGRRDPQQTLDQLREVRATRDWCLGRDCFSPAQLAELHAAALTESGGMRLWRWLIEPDDTIASKGADRGQTGAVVPVRPPRRDEGAKR